MTARKEIGPRADAGRGGLLPALGRLPPKLGRAGTGAVPLVRTTKKQMDLRLAAFVALIAEGFTAMDAGRELGLNRNQVEHIAQKHGVRALHGALSEARSAAAIKGNAQRWGG